MFDGFLAFVTTAIVSDKELVLYKILVQCDHNWGFTEVLTRTKAESRAVWAWASPTALLDHILSPHLAMQTVPQQNLVKGYIGSKSAQGHQ